MAGSVAQVPGCGPGLTARSAAAGRLPIVLRWLEVRTTFTATLTLDLLLGDVHSLKAKRGVVRPLLAEMHRHFGPTVAVAEVGHQDLHRRCLIGVAAVSESAGRCHELLDAVERLVAARPEIDLLSTRRKLHSDED